MLFAIAMAYLESAVVVYLRALYYPAGFAFPLVEMPRAILLTEIGREAATLVMLAMVAVVTGRSAWSRFGYFLICFGVWDIFYYIWLKLLLGWPSSIIEPDVLFLIPTVWVGPVVAPAAVALVMTVVGVFITARLARGRAFRVPWLSWLVALAASVVILYSFMSDPGAQAGLTQPRPYSYPLLCVGLLLYAAAWELTRRYSNRLEKRTARMQDPDGR